MERGLILYAEKRAVDLGIPYKHDTPPEELLAEVGRTERAGIGDIPASDFPSGCYGKFWGGYYDSDCAVCQIQATCLARFAADKLVEAEAALKTRNAYELAPYLSGDAPGEPVVPPGAVVLAQTFADDLRGQAPPNEPYPYKLLKGRRRPVPDLAKHRIKRPPWGVLSFACVIASQAAERPWPPALPDTHRWLGQCVTQTYAMRRRIQKDPYPAPKYGSATWQARYASERSRTPILQHLPVGSVLRRMWRGELVEVHVCDGYYVWRSYRYPTLYGAVCGVVGTHEYTRPKGENRPSKGTRRMGNFSARRFFSQAFAELEKRTGVSAATRPRVKKAAP